MTKILFVIPLILMASSASGLAQADRAGWAAGTGAGAGAGFEREAVISTSSFSAGLAAAGAGNGSALRAATV